MSEERKHQMPEEIAPNIYRLEIPLPGSPLKALNSYVVKGRERHFVVDCGMRRRECRDEMLRGLGTLGIDLTRTDFFITHFHADHLGLVSDLATRDSRVYLNRPDATRLASHELHGALARSARSHGISEDEIERALKAHPGWKYGPELPLSFTMPEDGDTLQAGGYSFRCIATPGHSFGHLCLYEPQQKILIAGDHILGDITPNIQAWVDNWNPVKEYMISLDKVARLDVAVALPGHRSLVADMRARIEELKDHHVKRAEEVLAILKGGPKTAYDVASEMTWDIVCDSFDLFPISQKWFATGEAIAHLLYVEELGKVWREQTAEKTFIWHIA